MKTEMQSICPKLAQCKCCGAEAVRYGVVDFHKNCEHYRSNALDLSGIPIYYHRCPMCGFIFTTAFDQFTNEDFGRFIYNEQYPLIDPDYKEARPRGNAGLLCNLFPVNKPRRMLDYGGGSGLLAEALRTVGFPRVDTYDPFVQQHAARPTSKYDLVLCFEVVEHSTKPREIFADIVSFLGAQAMAVVSTQMQPKDIIKQGPRWQYINPRAGHASIYSPGAFRSLLNPMGLTYASGTDSLHAIWRDKLPLFAQHLAQ